jgi:hypothetical protein
LTSSVNSSSLREDFSIKLSRLGSSNLDLSAEMTTGNDTFFVHGSLQPRSRLRLTRDVVMGIVSLLCGASRNDSLCVNGDCLEAEAS